MRSAPLILVLVTTACGGVSPIPPATARSTAPDRAAADEQDTFPTPYTAEQIRDATRPGRTYTWRVEMSGEQASERTTVFTQVDAVGAQVSSNGALHRVTWEELRRHAAFPRAAVTTYSEKVTVPAGTFECIIYVVDDRTSGEVSTYYFAKEMAGAPVLFFVDKAGTRTSSHTLIRYASGAGGAAAPPAP